jgi:hypothetical protein
MTPDEIAETILGTMSAVSRKQWRYKIASEVSRPLVITFKPAASLTFLDIAAVMGCFHNAVQLRAAWQQDERDEQNSPRIVIQGGFKGGGLVQATFVLKTFPTTPDEDA